MNKEIRKKIWDEQIEMTNEWKKSDLERLLGEETPPYNPNPLKEPSMVCPLCGMVWKGAMLYSCSNAQCPVQLKTTC